MIEKIDTSQNQDFLEKSLSKQPSSGNALSNIGADVSLQVDYASFINKVMQAQHTDTEAVQRAQELLLSGQLDSPENIRAATENIIKSGI